MGDFLKFSFRSREGLLSYIRIFGECLLGVMFISFLLLIVFIYDGDKYIDIASFEVPAAFFAGGALIINLSRMLRFSVNGGTSRRSFLLSTGLMGLVYGAVSTVMIQLTVLFTALVYRCFGMKTVCFVSQYCYNEKLKYGVFDPKIILLNISVVFFFVMLAFMAALVYLAVKSRWGTKIGAAAAGILLFVIYGSVEYSDIHGFEWLFDGLEEALNYAEDNFLLPEPPYVYMDNTYHSFGETLSMFLLAGLGLFTMAYLVYFLLLRRAPVRGRA